MKFHFLFATAALISCVSWTTFNLQAEENISHIVFSGNGEDSIKLNLSDYKRITFNHDSFTVSAPGKDDKDDIVIYYADAHHIEFRNEKSIPSNIEESAAQDPMIIFSKGDRMLKADFNDDTEISVTVFSAEGREVISSMISNLSPISLGSLPPGIYIASATLENRSLTIKFILY